MPWDSAEVYKPLQGNTAASLRWTTGGLGGSMRPCLYVKGVQKFLLGFQELLAKAALEVSMGLTQ